MVNINDTNPEDAGQKTLELLLKTAGQEFANPNYAAELRARAKQAEDNAAAKESIATRLRNATPPGDPATITELEAEAADLKNQATQLTAKADSVAQNIADKFKDRNTFKDDALYNILQDSIADADRAPNVYNRLHGKLAEREYLKLIKQQEFIANLQTQLETLIDTKNFDPTNSFWQYWLKLTNGDEVEARRLVTEIINALPARKSEMRDNEILFYKLREALKSNPDRNTHPRYPTDLPERVSVLRSVEGQLNDAGFSEVDVKDILNLVGADAARFSQINEALGIKQDKNGQFVPAESQLDLFKEVLANDEKLYNKEGFLGFYPQKPLRDIFQRKQPDEYKNLADSKENFKKNAERLVCIAAQKQALENRIIKLLQQKKSNLQTAAEQEALAKKLANEIYERSVDEKTRKNVEAFNKNINDMRMHYVGHRLLKMKEKMFSYASTAYGSYDKLCGVFMEDSANGIRKSHEDIVRAIPIIGPKLNNIFAGAVQENQIAIEQLETQKSLAASQAQQLEATQASTDALNKFLAAQMGGQAAGF